MRAITIAWAATFALLVSGLYAFYRQHGAEVWVALAALAALMVLQAGLLRATRGNVLEQSAVARDPFVRLVFPIFTGFALWLDVLAPHWYRQGNVVAGIAFSFSALYLAAIVAGVAAIVIALLRRKIS